MFNNSYLIDNGIYKEVLFLHMFERQVTPKFS